MLSGKGKSKSGGSQSTVRGVGDATPVWLDRWLANEMVRLSMVASEAYNGMRFKEALKVAWYGMQEARDRYRTGTAAIGLSPALVRQWAKWQALMMMPIIPHWSEAVWDLLYPAGTARPAALAVHARWPSAAAPVNGALTAAGDYLFATCHSLAAALVNRDKKKKPAAKGKEPEPTEKPNQVRISRYGARSRTPRFLKLTHSSIRPVRSTSTWRLPSRAGRRSCSTCFARTTMRPHPPYRTRWRASCARQTSARHRRIQLPGVAGYAHLRQA